MVNIEAEPIAKVQWSKDGEDIYSGNGEKVETARDFSRLSIKGTSGANTGTYKVVAKNEVGSAEATFKVVIRDRPGPPKNLQVTGVGKTFVELNWEEPENDGASPITGYVVEKADPQRKNFAGTLNTESDTLNCKVSKLFEGNEYLFRVCAENAIGIGEPVILAEPVVAKLPFGKYHLVIF